MITITSNVSSPSFIIVISFSGLLFHRAVRSYERLSLWRAEKA